MRFSAIHKVSSYLMVACAFLPLALSGELPVSLVALVLVGGVASIFVDPARSALIRRPAWSAAWNVVTVGAFGWRLFEWLVRGEALIVSGVWFLCVLLLNKLWNRRASKDYLQAYVVSFLMLVAGTTLMSGLVYAVAFVGYVVFTTWTLTLFHLRREMEENYLLKHSDDAQSERVEVERILNSRRVVGASFLAGTALVASGIFIASGAIFFLFPRVDFGGFFGGRRSGMMTTGFSDRLELGHYGVIKDNPLVVLRVELPDGPPREPLHFRGVAFDTYAHGRWSRGDSERSRIEPHHHIYRLPRPDLDERTDPRATLAGLLEQRIYLDPLDTPVLFAASDPIAFTLPPPRPAFEDRIEVGAGDEVYAVTLDSHARPVPVASGRRYTAWSRVAPPDETKLTRAGELDDDEREELAPNLSIPRDLPARVRALAEEMTRGKATAFDKAEAVAGWLRSRYRYTQELKRDERYEPLEDFLFVQHAGHCEYFASAMAVLLRAVGVPTRSVNGFYGGEWNAFGSYLAVRQGDAHSWVEVYFHGVGWVTFDPTPPGLGTPEIGMVERLRQVVDTLQLAWFKYVIEYDLAKQVDVLTTVRQWLSERKTPSLGRLGASPLAWLLARWRALVGALLVAVAAAWLLLRRRRGGARTERGVRRRVVRATHALERALRALERRGLHRRDGETVRELAERAGAARDPGAAPFARLVDHYYAARFGGAEVDAAEVERLGREVARPPVDEAAA